MADVDVRYACSKCEGTGEVVEPAGASGGEGRTTCPVCGGDGKRSSTIDVDELNIVLNTLLDRTADILDKCNDIFEKVNV